MTTPEKSHTVILQFVGKDGAGWFEEVGRVHDNRIIDSDARSRYEHTKQRIDKYLLVSKDVEHIKLLRALQLVIARDEASLEKAQALNGVRPANGLFEKIKQIVDEAPPWESNFPPIGKPIPIRETNTTITRFPPRRRQKRL